ncbi:MAG: RHS repeat-associated core domain-containing protein, partial [Clostridia bacterium]|nr:RHS repeat-associated core domain-containing protein [Clostridia bacterium]
YDAQGRRIRKNSKYYEYENGKLFRSWETPQTLLTYLYDTTGICGIECKRNFVFDPETGFHYDPTTYVFKKNLQGDVIAIYTLNGTKVAEYAYDAWGKCTIISDIDGIGVLNPIRYRGYYYDTETGLYYLNSRYYDPNTGRFINADSQFDDGAGILGNNLYAYCANNPITYKDETGKGIILACTLIGLGIGALIGGISAAVSSKEQLGYVDASWVFGGAVYGGCVGAFFGFAMGTVAYSVSSVLLPKIIGSLGATLYSNWQVAEQSLRTSLNSVTSALERTLITPLGNRIVDAYNVKDKIIAEAKYGYQGLSQFIQSEIARDAWLLKEGGIKVVEWHFYVSQITGKGGASDPLLEALLKEGFKVIYH